LCEVVLDPKTRGTGSFVAIGSILDTLAQKKVSIADDAALVKSLTAAARKAKQVVENPDAAAKDKVEALALLGRGLRRDPKELEIVAAFLNPRTPEPVQAAAMEAILRQKGSNIGELLLQAWKGYSPRQRSQVLDTLLSREELTLQLLDQIEKKKVLPLEI